MVVAALLMGAAVPGLAAAAEQITSDADAPRLLVAQTQVDAQMTVRLQELEEQVRSLSGQVDGLTFQLTQMQTLIERMNKDNEARFGALEGGAGGKTSAATPSGGVTPAGALPQSSPNDGQAASTVIPEQGVQPLPGEAEIDPTFGDDAPGGSVGASGDPLVGTGEAGSAALGGTPGTPQPLDLNYDPGAVSSDNKDADAQYAAGYDAILRGDYLFAEDQFEQYLKLYPSSAQYSDAANWLGEALIQRQAFDQAADVLLTAFQKKPDSPRAPDLLLRLGISLSGANERTTACRTFGEINKRYTNLTAAFRNRLAQEETKAQCPPA